MPAKAHLHSLNRGRAADRTTLNINRELGRRRSGRREILGQTGTRLSVGSPSAELAPHMSTAKPYARASSSCRTWASASHREKNAASNILMKIHTAKDYFA